MSVLYGLRALFGTHEHVSRLDFRRYVDSLELTARYPGFDVVNFAARVPASERRQFEQAVRADTSLNPQGYPDFAIKPPGDRPEYHVMVYLEPMVPFRFAFGLDIAASTLVDAEAKELLALQHETRDSGNLIASGRLIRVKRDPEYVGLAIRLAAYRAGMPLATLEQRRAAFIGTVGAGFNVLNLMKDALSADRAQYMRFRLFDVGPANAPASRLPAANERLLFDNQQPNLSKPALERENVPHFSREMTTVVGGRLWQIRFDTPRSAAVDTVDATLPWLVLMGGLFSTVLLTGFLYSLASSQRRAVALATTMTKDLRESRALLNDAQKLSHVGCCQYDPADGSMIWSEELHRIFGVFDTFVPSLGAMIDLVHPDERATVREAIARAPSLSGTFTFECRIVRPDGAVRHLQNLGEVVNPSGAGPKMLWSLLDVTHQKAAEAALRTSAEQLSALSRRLVEVQETERRQLARELHDRVGQNLTALSINLDILSTQLKAEAGRDSHVRLQDSSALVEATADAIDDVMTELRPPMLDDYGLLSALEWYAKDFSRRTGLLVRVSGAEAKARPASDVEITLFRIAQEALTNVAKHAKAKHVDIRLDLSSRHWLMTVRDDGVGFSGAESAGIKDRHGLGMVTMRERSQAVGGQFVVRSAPGRGTVIEIMVPR